MASMTTHARVGRRTKRSPALVDALCRVLRGGATRRAACATVDIDSAQFYRWLEADAAFRSAIEAAEAAAELHFTSIVVEAAKDTWQAATWWLERRRYEDYGKRERIDVDVRHQAEQLAAELGLDADELIAEAERITSRRRV